MSASSAAHFETTRWSIVLQASADDGSSAADALETLCRTYWFPLYAFARRRGKSPDDAADLTQDFFASLLDKRTFETAEPDRGRFRSFLLTLFQRFLIRDYERNNAARRGGGRKLLSLDSTHGEQLLAACPGNDSSAEALFDREWALALLNRAYERLADEYRERGRSDLFEHCRAWLVATGDVRVADSKNRPLGMTEGAYRVAVHRLRQRFRDVLRQEVAATVDDDSSVDDELRRLKLAMA